MEKPFTNLVELSKSLAGAILSYLDKPFILFGHSMGAMVSFELARELRRDNLEPLHIFASGCHAPQIPDSNILHDLPESELIKELHRLNGTPKEVLEAEAKVEGSAGSGDDLERCAEQVLRHATFREDAHASADYRRRVARTLTLRALRRAIDQARNHEPAQMERPRPLLPVRLPVAVPYFTSGRIEMTVNGVLRAAEAEARTTLLEWLRREGYWGVKHGCETGECGACTVLLDGRPVLACLTLALRAQGRSVLTVEGLGNPDRLHPIQTAFVETGAIQCGYCTPAMELCAKALLDAQADPSELEVRDALAGCLCRCTGYVKPVEAVRRAARESRQS